ncbi:chromosome segregation protein SMC [Halomarina oriensis]|uniref:Chromosome partition protein Smc n=1 Tax=Halomarina oriensis TaxID=671145 RepID=A0A6B0GNF5_9EURY|nr:chromosome segregation protein SMC [Halomarina oriensis]MWG35481.1 chromosome segregation protein SMC [Halomarina oriensis]
MHIKELVLDDFKSFGRKTRIPFYEDFTTISGPNGSGKSNIIDSVLFALGLARTSGIRAEKLTDLIYNPDDDGTEFSGEREAAVEVVLDNGDGTLTRSQVTTAAGTDSVGDTDEIVIKRRVKQTEDNYYSYYYLNGRSVNLSDIQDLLAQAGVAPEGYNVVMQGDVTEIINMTPGSRREIIDEIAGVAEFDARKADAMEELETVEERVDEADLRIEEKQERLHQLEDERETALQYQDLKEEREEYEGYLKAAELEDKRAELERTESKIERDEETLADRQRELDEKQGTVVRLEEDLEDLNAEIERTGEDEQLRVKREIEEVKGEISRLEDQMESARERIKDAENKRRQAFVKVDRKQERVDDLHAKVRNVKVEKASLKADRQEKQAELESVEADIAAVDDEYEQLKTDLADARDRLEEAKVEKNELQREQDRLLDEARRRTNEQRDLREEIADLESEIPDLEADIADLEAELEKARKNKTTIESVVDDLRAEKYELQDDLDSVDDEVSAAQAEYAELEAKAGESGDSSYGRAVTTVLNADKQGVHGTVGQLGGVSPQYATACETAAGGRLANVVVEDDGVGQRCIEFLKSRNAGRATFLPMSKMHGRSLPSLPSEDGVVDFVYNLVDFDPMYADVFSYVVGDTLVVEDMATARDLMGKFRMVTVDGDLVEKSGAMTGGSRSGSRYSFSSGAGQLERVAKRINELEEKRQSVREELRDVESRLDDARDRQANAADKVRDVETEMEKTEGRIEEIRDTVERKEGELDAIDEDREEVSERMDDLEADIAEQDETIEAIESDIADLEAELRDSEVAELTERAEAIREEIATLDEETDDLDGRLNELQLEKQYAEEAIEDLHDDIESAQNRKAEAEERVVELESEIEDQNEVLEEKHEQVADLEAELTDLKEERDDLKADLREAREERDAAKEKLGRVESRLDNAREKRDRLEWEVDELAAQVGDYDPEDVPDHDTVEAEIARLDVEMEALEPVNMLAIDEYDAVAEDLADLEEKRETLVEERDGIVERIEGFEAKKKATFMESYEAIREHFEDIFERLSSGSGTLVLEDETDPFEGGLTMKAQPRDKPVQRLDAMSGGEKSLTALAFIFAIQRHNPAPFYALDEVDAFLDAANAEAVGEMVDALADDAQFIVVSHRSALLERSERAIGVTMMDDNVSAVTGIDLSGQGVPADD